MMERMQTFERVGLRGAVRERKRLIASEPTMGFSNSKMPAGVAGFEGRNGWCYVVFV